MRKLLSVLTIIVLLLPTNAVALAAPPVQANTTVPVTVTITRVVELSCDDDDCPNDYYPKFDIDAQGLVDKEDVLCCAHPTGIPREFSPNGWVFKREVDSSHNPVLIHIELYDQDDVTEDDEIDISPDPEIVDSNGDVLDKGRVLDVLFDLNTCVFKGLGETPKIPSFLLQGHAHGDDMNSAAIYFTITTDFCDSSKPAFRNGDFDDDGLLNSWEFPGMGLDVDNDGTVDLALADPPFNANPLHKDLFVEVDWMACSAGGCAPGDTHSHVPENGALTHVENAFAAAPVNNPDGSKGITLHLDRGEAVPDVIDIAFEYDKNTRPPGPRDDFDDIKLGTPNNVCDGFFGTAADRASSTNCYKILFAKQLVFRYMIFGHSFKEAPGSSGSAESGRPQPPDASNVNIALGGNDFIVTVGPRPSLTAQTIMNLGGKQEVEESTFMHELGHTLGLLHGGDERFVNCKPNYLSVMNYVYQFRDNDPNRPLDYSSAATGTALGTLNENGGLNETTGIGGPTTTPQRLIAYGVGGNLPRSLPAANARQIDWNGDGLFAPSVTADINFIAAIQPSVEKGGCGTASPGETLHGYDDWKNLRYNFRESSDFEDGARGPSDPELTGDVLLAMSAQANLKLAKLVDKSTAIGGDTLNYSVPVTNIGRGKAISVSLTDTLPDGSTQTRALPDLDTDASNTQTFTFLVPCTAADGTVFTNHASVTGTDESGIPDPNLSDNTAQASTTVQTPVLTLAKTATASVNAGEAITYTITYENTGSGAAGNVVITDVLPAGIYYSKALDLGSGPKPGAVTVNANGTRTLTWNVGVVPASSGPQTIVYSARPTLLALGGTSYSNNASLSFQNGNGCVYDMLTASASTSITVVPPTRDPLTLGFWRTHPEQWTAEILARIQATDQRYDTNGDGALAVAEATTMFASGGNQPKVLQMQLLATYFNLATRRINAGTAISSTTAASLSLVNIRDAALFAIDTLLQPVNQKTKTKYDKATSVLDEINNNKSEVY